MKEKKFQDLIKTLIQMIDKGATIEEVRDYLVK